MPLHQGLLAGGLALALLAVPLLLLGGGAALKTRSFLAKAEVGVAEIVACRENPSARRSRTWTTTFAVVGPDGARLTAEWSGDRAFRPGGTAHVRHLRTPFVRIQPDDRWAAWGWAWVLGGLGGVVALLAALSAAVGMLLRRRGSGRIAPMGGRRAGPG